MTKHRTLKRLGAWIVTAALLLTMMPTSSFAVSGNTIYTNMKAADTGTGSQIDPFKNFEDAVAAADDGDTIVIQGSAILNEKNNAPGVPQVFNKSVTVRPEGDTAELRVRTAGMVLGADVKFENIELAFSNKYHSAIFANGHSFTATNVTRGSGSRQVHVFAGSIGASANLAFNAPAGNAARITLNNCEFGNIYAGGVADGFTGNTEVTLRNCKTIGTVYGSGAEEVPPDNNWFDITEPAPPQANTAYTAGNVAVSVDGSAAMMIDGAGAQQMDVTITAADSKALSFDNVNTVTVDGVAAKFTSINEAAAVTMKKNSTLDLSAASDVTIASLSGEGKLILNKNNRLSVTGELNGSYVFETDGAMNGASGTALYNHTYITSGGGSATITFTAHSTQGTMKLVSAGNEWKTTSAPTAPSTVSEFRLNSAWKKVSIADLDHEIVIPVTWKSSKPDSEFASLAHIPFEYELTYNRKTYNKIAEPDDDSDMYSAYMLLDDGKHLMFSAGDAYDEDPDRIDINTDLPVGTYNITIRAPKADGSKIEQTLELIITKKQATITVKAEDKGNGTVVLTSEVSGVGDEVPEGTVAFFWGNDDYIETLVDGVATHTLTDVAAQTYTYRATYIPATGSEYDAIGTANETIQVSGSDMITSTTTTLETSAVDGAVKFGDTLTLTAHVVDQNGKPLENGSTVCFWVNNRALTKNKVKVVNGVASTSVTVNTTNNFSLGEVRIYAQYQGTPGSKSDITKITVQEKTVEDNMLFMPSNIAEKVTKSGNAANLEWNAGTNTLTVKKDFTSKKPMLFSGFSEPVTLDMNGKTVTFNVPNYGSDNIKDGIGVFARDGAKLTILDSSANKTGKLISNASLLYMNNGAEVTIKSGTLVGNSGNSGGVILSGDLGDRTSLDIQGGVIRSDIPSSGLVTGMYCLYMFNSDVTVSGGALEVSDADSAQNNTRNTGGLRAGAGTHATVTGGSFTNFWGPCLCTYGKDSRIKAENLTLSSKFRTIEAGPNSKIELKNCRVEQTLPTDNYTGSDNYIYSAILVDGGEAVLEDTSVSGVNQASAAVYVQRNNQPGRFTMEGSSIKASSSIKATNNNALFATGSSVIRLTNVNVDNTVSNRPTIYVNNSTDLTLSNCVLKGGDSNTLAVVDGASASVENSTISSSSTEDNQYPAVWVKKSTLNMTGGSVTTTHGQCISMNEQTKSELTNVTFTNTQSGGCLNVYGNNAETAAELTLNNCKARTESDSSVLLANANAKITVNSGTYYTKSGWAMWGNGTNSIIINGGYFHGYKNEMDGVKSTGATLVLPENKVLRNDTITQQERDDNNLGTDYWWRLANRTYTLHFDVNGGAVKPAFPDQTLEQGAKAVKPTDIPKKNGHRFLGWKYGDGFVDWENFTMPDSDVTFTAAWELGTYTIQFVKNLDDAVGEMPNQTYKFDGSLGTTLNKNQFTSPTKNFVGWAMWSGATKADFSDEEVIGDAIKARLDSFGSTSLYAIWEDKPDVTVTFDASTNGGQFADNTTTHKTQTGKPNTALTLPDVKDRTGFNFAGWWTQPNGGTPITEPAVFPSADTTYYAQWTEKDAVEVIFTSGEGVWNDNTIGEKKISTKPGSTAAIPGTVSRAGYVFDGWKSDNASYPDLTADADKTAEIQEGQAVRYTPKWIAKTYTIHFDKNGLQDASGTVNDMAYVYDTQDAVLTTNVFTSDTKNMLGWSLDKNADSASYPAGAEIDAMLKNAMVNAADSRVTLYAIWTDKDAVTMTFNAGEGIFADSAKEKIESVKPGQQNKLPAAPTREGYTFAGWASNDTANYPDLAKDAVDTPAAIDGKNVTYTAKWVKNPNTYYVVVFSAGENGIFTAINDPLASQSVKNGDNVTAVPAVTANNGYAFSGWKIGGTGTVYTSAQVMAMSITKNLSFTAAYTKISSGGGGGGGPTSYIIKASAGSGGTISPNGNVSVLHGSSKSFTITASDGYKITDVLVDGKSVGAVATYTFSNVREAHTITVSFTKEAADEVADPNSTGVGSKLNTKEHLAFMQGYGNGVFGPSREVTRAQVAQIFYNLLLNKDVDTTVSFSDVTDTAWYSKAVNTLASMDVIKGVGQSKFAPERAISRAEFAAIATRFAKASNNGEVTFTDVSKDAWYYNNVLTAVQYGWIDGYTDNTFKPNKTITRAESAKIVNRMLARSADKNFVNSNSEIRRFSDVNSSNWAYYEIMEAANAHNHKTNGSMETWTSLKQ